MFGGMQQIRRVATTAASWQTTRKDVNTLKLYVANLPWTVGKGELRNYFAQFGPVTRAEVTFDKKTGLSRGFGFVSFEFSHSLVKALRTPNQRLEGHLLEIDIPKLQKRTSHGNSGQTEPFLNTIDSNGKEE